jgi:hypothetical protein
MAVLESRGELDADGPEAQRFVHEFLRDTIMHEVGHALGLRHNFRASRVFSESQLADPEFTRTHGTTGSVMDYNAVNLPRPGETGGAAFQLTLGPYDYWAVEYLYKPAPPGATAADEEAELQRVASRNHEPLLAFGSDEDAFLGIDPESVPWDLGSDPIAFAEKRLAIARDLFARQETRTLRGDRDYAVLRRSITYALNDAAIAVGTLVRHIGGLRTLRDYPGSGRDPLQPVSADVQRRALDLIARSVFMADGLSISPTLQRRLAPDFQDRAELPGLTTDFSLPQRLFDLQRAVLGQLLSDGVAARILDSLGKHEREADAFQLGELYSRLARDLWSELGDKGPIPVARRELQRDHANRIALAVLRPAVSQRADASSLMRQQARALLARLDARLRKTAARDEPTRLHLHEAADALRQALAARVIRATP